MRTTIAAIAIVIIGGCSGSAAHPRSASPRRADVTQTTTIAQSEFCVLPISRAAAIARVMRASDEVAPGDTAKAKLFGTDYWAVEVVGSVTPAFSRGGPSGWAVYDIDAHSGDIRGVTAGPVGSTPTDWESLPDPASRCPSG
jgi:hypothetical protein